MKFPILILFPLIFSPDEDTDIETVCTLLQAPADTNLLPQKHLFTTATPIAMSSDDFMSVTYQIPKTAESQPGRWQDSKSKVHLMLINMYIELVFYSSTVIWGIEELGTVLNLTKAAYLQLKYHIHYALKVKLANSFTLSSFMPMQLLLDKLLGFFSMITYMKICCPISANQYLLCIGLSVMLSNYDLIWDTHITLTPFQNRRLYRQCFWSL